MKTSTFTIFLFFLLYSFTACAQYFEPFQINPFGMEDIGASSRPAFVDIDDDGDFDLFVGDLFGDVYAFENIGTVTSPDFVDLGVNLYGLHNVGFSFQPEFADVDDDGDFDAIAGAHNGDILFFRNSGNANAPIFDSAVANPQGLTNVGVNSAPSLIDIDDDDDLDVFSGDSSGTFRFMENTGTANFPNFGPLTVNPFGLDTVGFYSIPEFVDVDDDGDFDAFCGNATGQITFFENTGTASNPQFSNFEGNPFNLSNTGTFSAPVFCDIDNDGDADAFAGNSFGNVLFFEHTEIPPSITGIANQIVCMDSATDTMLISVFGLDTANTIYSAVSDNQDLLPDGNIQVNGTYPDFSIIATPAAGEAGSVNITLTFEDSDTALSSTFNILVYFEPEITLQPQNVTGCEGDVASFTIETIAAGFLVQWKKDGVDIAGANQLTYTIFGTTIADEGDYTCEVSGACGNPVLSDLATLTLTGGPEITLEPADVTACEGDDISLSVTAQGGNLDYQWWLGFTEIAGATSSILSLSGVTIADAGIYVCVVSDGNCTTLSSEAIVNVAASPAIFFQSGDTTLCVGDNVTLSVTAAGTGLSYQWQKDGVDIPGENSAELTFSDLSLSDGAGYTCLVGANCTSSSDPILLSVEVCSGIFSISEKNGFHIFPNPSSGSFTIELNEKMQNAYLEMVNSNGQLFYEKEIGNKSNQTKIQLDVSPFSAGVYLVKISNQKSVIIEKLIIE